MSSYVYMRLLESAPQRYDVGIRLLSLGRVRWLYEKAAAAAVGGALAPHILELGCGTGNLTRELLRRGAVVTGIDYSAEMLAVARDKLEPADGTAQLHEMAAVEIADRFPAESFDAVVGALVLSEMNTEEQRYVLAAARRVLRPGGRLVIADELRPPRLWQRVLHGCLRWPAAVLTYVLTQTTTWAIRDLAPAVRAAGFRIVSEERTASGSMGVVVAEKD